RSPARDSTRADSTRGGKGGGRGRGNQGAPNKKAGKDSTPVDLTVELVDADGHTARLPLSRFGVPRRPLEIHILRRHDQEQQRFPTQYELVLQTYVMPLSEFAAAGAEFDPARLRQIRLVFDRLVQGTVVMDDVGVSNTAGPFEVLGEPTNP